MQSPCVLYIASCLFCIFVYWSPGLKKNQIHLDVQGDRLNTYGTEEDSCSLSRALLVSKRWSWIPGGAFWPCFDFHKHHLGSILNQSFPWGYCWGRKKPCLGKSAAMYKLELVSCSHRPWNCNLVSPKTWLTPRDQNTRHHTERINLQRFWMKVSEEKKARNFRTE